MPRSIAEASALRKLSRTLSRWCSAMAKRMLRSSLPVAPSSEYRWAACRLDPFDHVESVDEASAEAIEVPHDERCNLSPLDASDRVVP